MIKNVKIMWEFQIRWGGISFKIFWRNSLTESHWQSSLSRRLLAFYTWMKQITECVYEVQFRSHGIAMAKRVFCGHQNVMSTVVWISGGGTQLFFQVGVGGPDFRSVRLANWYLPLKKEAYELEISKIGGLVSWNFPNLGACELKFRQKLRL